MRTHGKRSTYRNGCKCDDCRAANAAHAARRRRERAIPDDVNAHGRLSTYTNYMCRCPRCRAASNAAKRIGRR